MTLAIFGASGASGHALVAEALRRGHSVRAFCRPSTPWTGASVARVIHGTFAETPVVAAMLRGADAACCVFGPRPPHRDVFCAVATEAVLAAMRVERVERLVCQTGAMVGHDRIHWTWPVRLLAAAFRRQRPAVAADRARQEAIVQASGIAWTLIKPPRLRDGPRSGRVRLGSDLRIGLLASVRRADVAAVILDAVEQGRYIGQAIYVVGDA